MTPDRSPARKGEGRAATSELLDCRGVTKRFEGLVAVDGVDLKVVEGEIVGVIGPNGAGKTTLFNCLSGLEVPTSGEIVFQGRPLSGRPDRFTRAGLARTFQNIRLFPNMTALENVLVGRHCRTRSGVLAAIGRGRLYHREERESSSRADDLLDFVGLPGAGDVLAKNLPYGDQ
ncbi:MAG: ATP-binding cassette domain-containing protein, partial [Acidimicrobiales bacterium]